MSRFLMKVAHFSFSFCGLLEVLIPPKQRVSCISSSLAGDSIANLFLQFCDNVVEIGLQSNQFYEYEVDIPSALFLRSRRQGSEGDDVASLPHVIDARRRRQKLLEFSQHFSLQITEKMHKAMDLSIKLTMESHQLKMDQLIAEEKIADGVTQERSLRSVSSGAMGFLSFVDHMDIALQSPSPHSSGLSVSPPSPSPYLSLSSTSSSPGVTRRSAESKSKDNSSISNSLSPGHLSLSPPPGSYRESTIFEADPIQTTPQSHEKASLQELRTSSGVTRIETVSGQIGDDGSNCVMIGEKESVSAHVTMPNDGFSLGENSLRERGKGFVEREALFLLHSFYSNMRTSLCGSGGSSGDHDERRDEDEE